MTGWLVEDAPAAERAVLIADGAIVAAHIALKAEGRVRLGQVLEARWKSPQRLSGGERPVAALLECDGIELYLPRPPARTGPGSSLIVEAVREALWTPRGSKLAKVRISDGPVGDPPSLSQNLPDAGPLGVYEPDALEDAGWSELLEEAEHRLVEQDGVRLWLDATEAMTVIDVDGSLPPDDLAVAGAALAARTIARLDLGGMIGIDLPTVANRATRQAAAVAFDAAMHGPFERTAVNGFGFMQVVRPLVRPSILSIMHSPFAEQELGRRAWRAQYDAYLHRHA